MGTEKNVLASPISWRPSWPGWREGDCGTTAAPMKISIIIRRLKECAEPTYDYNDVVVGAIINIQNNVKHCFSQLPGVERGVFEVEVIAVVLLPLVVVVLLLLLLVTDSVTGTGESLASCTTNAADGMELLESLFLLLLLPPWLLIMPTWLLIFSLVPRMICLMVSLTLEASFDRVPLVLCLLCFIRRF